MSARRRLAVDLTPREREIAALLIEGLTSKLIGKRLEISLRTVDVPRAADEETPRGDHAGAGAEAVARLRGAAGVARARPG